MAAKITFLHFSPNIFWLFQRNLVGILLVVRATYRDANHYEFFYKITQITALRPEEVIITGKYLFCREYIDVYKYLLVSCRVEVRGVLYPFTLLSTLPSTVLSGWWLGSSCTLHCISQLEWSSWIRLATSSAVCTSFLIEFSIFDCLLYARCIMLKHHQS